jgi:hypothetical protein
MLLLLHLAKRPTTQKGIRFGLALVFGVVDSMVVEMAGKCSERIARSSGLRRR